MFNKMNKVLNIFARRSILQSSRLLCSSHYQIKPNYHVNNDILMNNSIKNGMNCSIIKRFKHKKKSSTKREQVDSDEDENEDEMDLDLDESHGKSKIVDIKVNSLRLDAVIKAGVGMARKKVEEAFYESKIRINGKKVLKISTEVKLDDEIDVIVNRPLENLNQLIVSRIKILSISAISGAIRIKVCRDKNLLIDEYSEL